jgi:hypothetical protein
MVMVRLNYVQYSHIFQLSHPRSSTTIKLLRFALEQKILKVIFLHLLTFDDALQLLMINNAVIRLYSKLIVVP